MRSRYFERTLTEDEDSNIRKKTRTQVKYFNKVYVMVTAASKMLSHAHFGQPREVMGLLQGKAEATQGLTMKSRATEYL